eukprot:m.17622 g.17622  ORF g.17622 m.17622 type:complete len:128 (-) comp11351_c0_seq2:116-499(-)
MSAQVTPTEAPSNRPLWRQSESNLPFCYLRVALTFQKALRIDIIRFHNLVFDGLKQLHGEVGRAIAIDILNFDRDAQEAILRVPACFSLKVQTALTIITECDSHPVRCDILQASSFLSTIACSSRRS